MASSESHLQTVVPEIDATKPRSIASRATSPALQRLKGTPLVAGNSQANAFISILASGGKDRRSARAGSILQSAQTLLVESFAPLTYRLGCGVQPPCDLLVGGPFGGQQHYPGANNLPVGGGVGARSFVEDGTLLFGELDAIRALGGHSFSFWRVQSPPKILSCNEENASNNFSQGPLSYGRVIRRRERQSLHTGCERGPQR